MKGTPVIAESIEYHERHSIHPDSVVPERFGKALEIPEDLVPVPTERPTALHANHPLAKYVTVYETVSEPGEEPRDRILHGHVEFVDVGAGVVVELFRNDELPAFSVLSPRARSGLQLRIEYNEADINDENDRRLKKALEIAAYYARVIDEHNERIEREKAEREAKSEEARKVEQDNAIARGEFTFPTQGKTQDEIESDNESEGSRD